MTDGITGYPPQAGEVRASAGFWKGVLGRMSPEGWGVSQVKEWMGGRGHKANERMSRDRRLKTTCWRTASHSELLSLTFWKHFSV